MDYFCATWDPLQFSKKLINSALWTVRFRIGDYRVICDIDAKGFLIIILVVGQRENIYQ